MSFYVSQKILFRNRPFFAPFLNAGKRPSRASFFSASYPRPRMVQANSKFMTTGTCSQLVMTRCTLSPAFHDFVPLVGRRFLLRSPRPCDIRLEVTLIHNINLPPGRTVRGEQSLLSQLLKPLRCTVKERRTFLKCQAGRAIGKRGYNLQRVSPSFLSVADTIPAVALFSPFMNLMNGCFGIFTRFPIIITGKPNESV